MSKVSIIIRTKNEERWIGHCLSMIYRQSYKDFEVILVDNDSLDHTLEIAKRFPVKKIINIREFKPGLALNMGIAESVGDFIICLSAHCVPKEINWISQLISNFRDNSKIAGVYGRQLPVSYTNPIDARDLLTTFGLDKRIQVKDYFFHNANSMILKEIWKIFPFDEKVNNIEDRIWGKEIVNAGFQIVYDPLASVYHYHGLHHTNNQERAKGVASIIQQQLEPSDLPDSLKPESVNIVGLIPVIDNIKINSKQHQQLIKCINEAKKSKFLKQIFVLSFQKEIIGEGTYWLDRKLVPDSKNLTIDKILNSALNLIESQSIYPEAIIYINYEYKSRPLNLYDELIYDSQYKGYDTVFAGYPEYTHFWVNNSGSLKLIDESLKSREERDPIYRALYGLGCLVSSSVIRKGGFIGENAGILLINNPKYLIRTRYKKI